MQLEQKEQNQKEIHALKEQNQKIMQELKEQKEQNQKNNERIKHTIKAKLI